MNLWTVLIPILIADVVNPVLSAALHLLAVEGAWRIRGIEILDERRVL